MLLNLVCRVLFRSIRVSHSSPIVVHNVRFSSFSSESVSDTENKNSFTTNYLVDTFGFSQEKAFSTSKYMKISSTNKAETVIDFLKKRGFTSGQIGSIVRTFPQIVKYDPHKVFVPKVEFFLSSGICEAEVNNIILRAPYILCRSLEKYIIPYFSYMKSLFDPSVTTLSFNKHLGVRFCCGLERLKLNVEILRDEGVPDCRILGLVQIYPRALSVEKERFRKVVKEVKEMKFVPDGSLFIDAVRIIVSMSEMHWEKKLEVYKKWGISEIDVIWAFKRYPSFMAISTDKINKVMMFLGNEMGLDYTFVVKSPITVAYNLEKRIKPRCAVYKVLVANNLIKNISSLPAMLKRTEANFVKEVLHYEREAPGVLQVYQKTLDMSNAAIC